MLLHARPKLCNPPPFSLGRLLGPCCNIISIVFTVCLTIFLSLPSTYPVTAGNMNYTSVIYVASLASGVVLWYTYGKKSYAGPHVDSSCFDVFRM